MRRFLCVIIGMLLLMPTAAATTASDIDIGQVGTVIGAPPSPLSGPLEELPIALDAPSVLLVDAESGQVIFEKGADIQRPVASVTKLMTLLLAFEAVDEGRLQPGDMVKVSKEAATMGGSQALLDAGSEYEATELIKSVIIASANDSSVALAEHLYGSEAAFVQRMNGRAAELGLNDTVYRNCTGLSAEGQHTTARDVAQLARMVAQHETIYEYSGIWLDEIVHPKNGRKTELANTNRLIRTYDGADGLKTGSTSDAMFCVAASATRGGMQLIAVVLGASSSAERFSIAAKMLDYGFDHYYLYRVADEGALVRDALPVKGGSVKQVDIVAGAPVRTMIKKGGEASVRYEVKLPEEIQAPFAGGAQVGTVEVYRDEELVASIPAVTAEAVENSGFFGTMMRIFAAWLR